MSGIEGATKILARHYNLSALEVTRRLAPEQEPEVCGEGAANEQVNLGNPAPGFLERAERLLDEADFRPERDALDAILVALWQCETERGFEHMADKVRALVAEARAELNPRCVYCPDRERREPASRRRSTCKHCNEPIVWHEGNGGQWLGATPPNDCMTCGCLADGQRHEPTEDPTVEDSTDFVQRAIAADPRRVELCRVKAEALRKVATWARGNAMDSVSTHYLRERADLIERGDA